MNFVADVQVQFQCNGNVVTIGTTTITTTTSGSGTFFIAWPVSLVQNFTSSVLSDCTLVVTTMLNTCDSNLPSVGRLVSTLQFLRGIQIGFLRAADLIPAGFEYFNP